MAPFVTALVFAAVLIGLGIFKPQAARIVVGVFFLLMGLVVNVIMTLIDPSLYVAAGQNALLPLYRWFFTTVLAWNPVVFIIPLILIEAVIGLLILNKGQAARLGLTGAVFFCLAMTPVGVEELTALPLALAIGLLLRQNYDRSLPDLVARRLSPARSSR